MRHYVGLDLSLRSTGIVACPSDWGYQWSRVNRFTAKHPAMPRHLDAQVLRIEEIAGGIVFVLLQWQIPKNAAILIEEQAFSRRSSSAHKLAFLHYAVLRQLCECGFSASYVVASAARKTLLGGNYRKETCMAMWGAADIKDAVWRALTQAGGTFASKDESDAFCIVNHQMSEDGVKDVYGMEPA